MLDAPLEDMMGQIGEFGNYQAFQHCLHILTSFLAGLHLLSQSFTAPTPPHRCYVPALDGAPYMKPEQQFLHESKFKNIFSNKSLPDINEYIPYSGSGQDREYSQCTMMNRYTGEEISCMLDGDGMERYVYDFSSFHPTVRAVEYGLVCGYRWKRALMTTIYLFGVLNGAIWFGPLADRVGRKPVLCICGWAQVVFAVGIAFVHNYYAYLVVLWFYGVFASGGAYVTGFCLSMELVGSSYRTICGTNFSVMFTMGTFLLVLTAYFIRNAITLQIVLGCYSLLLAGHWWYMDESIRWLWSKDRRAEAIRIAQKAAKMNKRVFVDRYTLPPSGVPSVTDQTEAPAADNPAPAPIRSESQSNPGKFGLTDLFRTPVLRTRTFLVAFNWFANAVVFYGISFNTEDLSGDPFANFAYSCLAELPGFIIVNFGVPYTGRRTLMAVCLAIGGLMCFVVVGFPKGTITTTFSILAKVGIAVSFTIIYNYTAEVFPTVVRNSAVGFCTMAARVGGMVTPFLSLLDTFYAKIPAILFGAVAIIGGIMCTYLPETSNTDLPQTLEDGENFQRGDTAFSACFGKKKKNGYVEKKIQNKNAQPGGDGAASEGETMDNSLTTLPETDSAVSASPNP